ncbi:nucleotide sugar dehydrogenase [Micromonospora endophytica]|uniref:Nucleotide sugar dehydrogenase n=1 Tax=Micromonospora endophytica TaxID=515350 RepID=A0A2W2CN28_9ACTN|nr:nucleotide sugar dehydrogenase [Micromonospora endophytica]RIW46208.1 nucleotide sugar dehydrogenase [Micromonospora endophytica]
MILDDARSHLSFEKDYSPTSTEDGSTGESPRVSYDLAVIGLGYVGLPLLKEAAAAGLRVIGVDIDASRVNMLNSGKSYVDDISKDDLGEMLAAGFRATTDPASLAESAVITVCVPTPLSDDHGPDLSAVRSAARMIAGCLMPGTLVVLESTTYPGTTEEVVRPILEESGLTAGRDFSLAYSPERIDPGNGQFGLRNTPKVVGGLTESCRDHAATFYGKLVSRVVPTSGLREAEMAKLLENTYRNVNIALVNEMVIFCEELGIDLWETIEAAATKPFGFHKFLPGPGVGGHCIPIDPSYLSHTVRKLGYSFRLAETADEINGRMPKYVASRLQRALNRERKSVNGARVMLLGVTYKPDIADDRETPALPLARELLSLGAELCFADPYIRSWSVDGVSIPAVEAPLYAVHDCDAVVLLQAHSAFDLAAITRHARLVLDTSGLVGRHENVERL